MGIRSPSTGRRILGHLAEINGVTAAPPDALVAVFDRLIGASEFFNPLFAAFVMSRIESGDPIAERALDAVVSGSAVMDCGSGIGRYSFHLARKGCTVQSWEINPAYVAFQNWISGQLGLGIDVRQGDFLEARNDLFDSVLCLFITLPDYSQEKLGVFFDWARGCLKPGGSLIMDAYTPQAFMEMFGDADSVDETPFGTLHRVARPKSGNRIHITHVWTVDGVTLPEETYQYVLPGDRNDVARAARSVGGHAGFLTDTVMKVVF